MKCENCIHYDVCLDIEKSLKAISNCISIKHTGCEFFKSKSLCVELPCKVGDIVHRVSFVNKNIETLKVEGFNRNLASWKVHCTRLIHTWLGNKREHMYISFSQFGKTVFLDREEAEKKLQEMV